MMKRFFRFCLIGLLGGWLFPSHGIHLEMSPRFSVGDGKIFFESIASICEDRDGSFYVLDRKAARVYKFSPGGNHILAFGRKGQGPGDFVDPHRVFISADNKIVVSDTRDFVSFFDSSGKFLERRRVGKGLGLCFLGHDLYYGWKWTERGRQQITVSASGRIVGEFFSVSRDSFSVDVPDETGRRVMCNYFNDAYTPAFLFCQYKNYFALGISHRYEILVRDVSGKQSYKISRQIEPARIQPQERAGFIRLIEEHRSLPEVAKKQFLKKIPACKNHLGGIRIAGHYLWAFRVKENTLEEAAPVPVDLFTLSGEFLGSVRLRKIPLHISPKYIYFDDTTDREDLVVTVCHYRLTPRN